MLQKTLILNVMNVVSVIVLSAILAGWPLALVWNWFLIPYFTKITYIQSVFTMLLIFFLILPFFLVPQTKKSHPHDFCVMAIKIISVIAWLNVVSVILRLTILN